MEKLLYALYRFTQKMEMITSWIDDVSGRINLLTATVACMIAFSGTQLAKESPYYYYY